MLEPLIPHLQCPYSGEALRLEAARDAYGWLRCEGGDYPVLAGIPVIRKDLPAKVIQAAKADDWDTALIHLLLADIPERFIHRVGRALGHQPMIGGIGRTIEKSERQKRQSNIQALVHPGAIPPTGWAYLQALTPFAEFAEYLYYKYTQPRHLVALELMEFPVAEGPVLDLGCGPGHLTRALQFRAPQALVIGLDSSFALLFCGRRHLAPEATFICADLEHPLPFTNETFGGIFSFDAFHNVRGKQRCAQELARMLTPDGSLVVASVRNALVPHRYQDEFISPDLLSRLFSHLHGQLLDDKEVLAQYLARQQLCAADARAPEDLAKSEMVTLVAGKSATVLPDTRASLTDWPHARGSLGLNPLYQAKDHQVVRHFPSQHYAIENAASEAYLAERIDTKEGPDLLAALAEGRGSIDMPGMEHLVEQFVAVGMPGGYRKGPRA